MDMSEVDKVVERNKTTLSRFMGVGHWAIKFVVCIINDSGTCARCDARPDYCRATIQIDHSLAESEMDVLESMFHELNHVVLSDMLTAKEVALLMIPNGNDDCSSESQVFHKVWDNCTERIITNMERTWRASLLDAYLSYREKEEAKQ